MKRHNLFINEKSNLIRFLVTRNIVGKKSYVFLYKNLLVYELNLFINN